MVSPLFIDNEIFSKEYCFELLYEKETFLNSIILDELSIVCTLVELEVSLILDFVSRTS